LTIGGVVNEAVLDLPIKCKVAENKMAWPTI